VPHVKDGTTSVNTGCGRETGDYKTKNSSTLFSELCKYYIICCH